MTRIGAVLAAGQSRRFGRANKLLMQWQGRPLVAWPADALLRSGCDAVLAIVSDAEVAAVLPGGVEAQGIAPGLPMSASFNLAVQIAIARDATTLLVCLGDMPNIDAGLLGALLARGETCACHHGGTRTPPVAIAAADFARALPSDHGDHGARQLIAALAPDRLLPISASAAHDVDRPPDIRWRSPRERHD